MEQEKRKYDRNEFNIGITAIINNKKIDCSSINISSGGALLRVNKKDTELITEDDIGIDAIFEFDNISTGGKFSGKITRVFANLNEKLIAVIFFSAF